MQRDSSRSPSLGSRKQQWSLNDFDIGRKLGEGRFGKIYLAREKDSKVAVVIKSIAKELVVQHNLVHQMRREIELHHYCRHRNIIRLLAYFWDTAHIYLVLEHAEQGDLLQHVQRNGGKLEEQDVARVVGEVVDALAFMHPRGIVHRDIKLENILLKKGRAKLADFTWAVLLSSVRRQTVCGTLDYLAPEMIERSPHGCAVDMWSLGVMAFELLVGSPPFERASPQETCSCIQQGQFTLPTTISASAADFIEQCLVHDPEKRITATDAMSHPWISTVVSQNVTSRSSMPNPSVSTLVPSIGQPSHAGTAALVSNLTVSISGSSSSPPGGPGERTLASASDSHVLDGVPRTLDMSSVDTSFDAANVTPGVGTSVLDGFR